MPGSSPEDKVLTTPVDPADGIQPQEQNSDGKSADSSNAEKDGGSMLDAVKSALKPKEESPASKEQDQQSEESDPEAKKPDGEAEDELSEDELKGLHGKVQKRFQRLTSKLHTKDEEINGLKPKAEELDKINTFIGNAGLNANDVGNLLTLGALIKTDPKAAYERMLPTIRMLQSYIGEVLPADLQKQVDDGYITEAHAKELVATRSRADFVDSRSREDRERQEAAERHQEIKRQTDSTLTAVETWEAKQAERDPDWSTKRAEVAEQVELAIRKKGDELRRPWFPTAEEAVALSKDALKTVEKRMSRFSPKPKSITPVDTSGASNRSKQTPNNMLDVVRQALGK